MSEHLRTHGYMPNFDMPPINIAFDLHRQFLPPDHPDREDKKNFTKGRVVHEVTEIPTFSGADVLAQLKALQPKVKGKAKAKAKGFEGYGETHN